MEPKPASALAALSSALLGCQMTVHQLAVLESLLRSRPAQERLALPVVVYLLDAWTLTRRPRARFRHLGPPDQARWIEHWLSALPRLLRRALAGLKSLAALAVYDDRDSWSRTGYDGPWLGRVSVAVLAELVPAVKTAAAMLDADVCVIGSGAGGASAAARLAERELQVAVLEAGPRTTAADCTQRELDMMARLYAERGLAGTVDQSITILRGRGLGGSTLHNTGLVVPPPRGVLERWRTEHGFDTPEATLELHVSRVLEALRAVPIPEDRVNTANQLLRAGAVARGWRFQIPQHNRVECSGCGYCMIGCAYNRKVNAAGAFLQAAAVQGATLLSDVQVESFQRARGSFVDRRAARMVTTFACAPGALFWPRARWRHRCCWAGVTCSPVRQDDVCGCTRRQLFLRGSNSAWRRGAVCHRQSSSTSSPASSRTGAAVFCFCPMPAPRPHSARQSHLPTVSIMRCS